MAWRSASSARGICRKLIAKADLNTYDRATSATRLQSCFHRRWRDVTSRRHIHLYTFVHIATEKDPQLQQSSYRERYGSKTYDLVPKRTIWLQNRRFWLPKQQQRRHTRARFCRLGPLDRTRLRCRTTVPQLVFTAMDSDKGSVCGSIAARALSPHETGDDGVEFVGEVP